MKTKLPLLCLCLLCAGPVARAYEPLYQVTLKTTPAFEIVGHNQLAFYPFSEQMGAMVRKNKVRPFLAADATSVSLRSERPREVLSQVLQQISEQTGLKLASVSNSTTPPTEPVYFRQGFSDTAVITLVLVPGEDGLFHLTCHYLISERPAGSNDGTPEAIVELQEMKKQIQEMQAKIKLEAAPAK
jgi:hypothetical protein